MHHSGEAIVQREKLIRVRTKGRAEEQPKKTALDVWKKRQRLSQTAVDWGVRHLAFIFTDTVENLQKETSGFGWLIIGFQCSRCFKKAPQKGFFSVVRLKLPSLSPRGGFKLSSGSLKMFLYCSNTLFWQGLFDLMLRLSDRVMSTSELVTARHHCDNLAF